MIKNFIFKLLGRRRVTSLRLRLKPRNDERDFLTRLLIHENPDESLMLDVGAHFGESLIPFKDYGWRVIAFEPDPDPRKKEVLKGLESERVSIEWCAVSDEEGELPIYASDVSTGITSLLKFHESHHVVGHVPVVTLEQVILDKSIHKVTYLKTDCEGFDFMALKGFPWGKKTDPEVVLCEFEDRKTKKLDYSWRDMAQFLVDRGYQVVVSEFHPIAEYGQNHPWVGLKTFPCGLESVEAWGNLIGVKVDDSLGSKQRQAVVSKFTLSVPPRNQAFQS